CACRDNCGRQAGRCPGRVCGRCDNAHKRMWALSQRPQSCRPGDLPAPWKRTGWERGVGGGRQAGRGRGMAEDELGIPARRAVPPAGVRRVPVAVRDGRIAALAGPGETPDAVSAVDLPGREVLLPGLVDTHVHVNEPGRTEWEGFATATQAAAAGGVTTLIDMPLNSLPPTTTPAPLAAKRAAAHPSALVGRGFLGGAVPRNPARPARPPQG